MANIDYLTQRGAGTLASRIRAFWAKRGIAVNVWTEAQGVNALMDDNENEPIYVVRSDIGQMLARRVS